MVWCPPKVIDVTNTPKLITQHVIYFVLIIFLHVSASLSSGFYIGAREIYVAVSARRAGSESGAGIRNSSREDLHPAFGLADHACHDRGDGSTGVY